MPRLTRATDATARSATVLAVAGLVTVVALGASRPALAAPAATATATATADAKHREEAKAAFVRGNTAYNLGKYPEAIVAFEQAYALSRLPDILFNLAQCYRKQWEAEKRSDLGRRALHYYEALLREAPSSPFRPDAEQFVAELGPAVAAAEAREREGVIAAARGGEALKLAQTMFVAGQLKDAAAVLDHLTREPGNGRELLAEAYLLRGRVAAGLGDVLAAESLFRRALELRPSAALVNPGPQELAALEAAKKTQSSAAGLRLVQPPLGEVPPGRAARVDVKIEGDSESLVTALELSYRRGESGAFLGATAKPPTSPEIPAPVLTPGARVDYYVRALDEAGSVLAESGAPTLPFHLQVADPAAAARVAAARPGPVYTRWWFWTLVGAAAVGAGAATYVATRPDSVRTIDGTTNR